MADNTTGTPVQTLTGQFVGAKLYDSAGTNVAAVDASGRLSTNIGSIGGSVPSATNPLFVELSTGAAAYTLFGQAIGTAPWTRITDGTTTAGVIVGSTALKTDLSSIAGTVPGAAAFVPARLTDGSAYYTRYGQAVATAQYAAITDGTLTATVRDTGTNDSLNVSIVDGSGNQIVSFGGGTQFAGDAAAGYAAIGTMAMAVAKAAAPSDMSADGDAVELWALRNGSQVVNLASGGTLITIGQKTAANGLPVTLASDQATAAAPLHVVLGTGGADYTLFGQAIGSAPWARITDGTTTAGVIVGTTALKTDFSSIAGTAPVSAGVAGILAIGGPVAHDGVISTNNPLILGARASAAAPSNVSADNDVAYLWALQNGSLVVNLAAGGTLLTNMGQAAASANFSKITDGTNTATVIATINSLKSDLSSIAGVVPGATSYVPARLTDGSAYYTNTGQTAGTAAFSRITDATNTAAVIATINSLKVDLASIVGAVPAAANPIPVRLTDGSSFYSAGSSAPTLPVYSTKTDSALGAGATATQTHYVASGKTGQLMGVDVGATVPLRCAISTVLTGSATTRVVVFTQPFQTYQWRTPYKTFITQVSADATTGFSCVIKNLDAAVAADVYSTAFWDAV